MKLKRFGTAALTAFVLASAPVLAGDISVTDAYMRTSTPTSMSGGAFLTLVNGGDTEDRLIAAASDVAARVEMHTHLQDDNGVMAMQHVEEGFVIPAHGTRALARGGDHLMFTGLNRPLEQGEEITVTLTFEKAGDLVVTMPVDRERRPSHGG